jgi:UDPglucose 6-dehydrogenase
LRVTAEDNAINLSLLTAALESNEKTHRRIVDKVEKELSNSLIGKIISVWGLTFKANTDDMRESPAIAVIERLIGRGASVVAFDPVIKNIENNKIKIAKTLEECCESADAILILTEWNEFAKVKPESVKHLVKNKIIVDARNFLDKDLWINSGFKFIGNGWQ